MGVAADHRKAETTQRVSDQLRVIPGIGEALHVDVSRITDHQGDAVLILLRPGAACACNEQIDDNKSAGTWRLNRRALTRFVARTDPGSSPGQVLSGKRERREVSNNTNDHAASDDGYSSDGSNNRDSGVRGSNNRPRLPDCRAGPASFG